jgi:hypothetical protein
MIVETGASDVFIYVTRPAILLRSIKVLVWGNEGKGNLITSPGTNKTVTIIDNNSE